MIKTKLIQLSYKVKNKTIKKTMRNQFYKRKILTTGFAIVQKGEEGNKKHKMLNTQQQPKQVRQWQVNSLQGSRNTHDPFQYSIISVF